MVLCFFVHHIMLFVISVNIAMVMLCSVGGRCVGEVGRRCVGRLIV